MSTKMPNLSAIVVRNLPRYTTKGDVKRFFDTRINNTDTVVDDLLQDTQNPAGNFQCATVRVKASLRKKALGLNDEDFQPAAGSTKSKIQIDGTFKGAIVLAEHTSPQFDIYFVHGVGGDAFTSWMNEETEHMWPKDSFPDRCLNLGVRGRISTLGYDAKVITKGKPKTIQSAAESILKYIRADRPDNCTRPIFFACHSLGGIVVAQALVIALTKPADKPEYQFIQHMIKGVAFFGTPFQGSRNADLIAPVTSLYSGLTRMSTSFMDDLKTSSKDLPRLTMALNHIFNDEKIEPLVFIEKEKDGPSKVTTRTSATLPFDNMLAPIEIDGDHRSMVKFPSGTESRHTITEIVKMIRRQLNLDQTPIPLPNPSRKSTSTLLVPGIDSGAGDRDAGFKQLSLFDTKILIDDSGSMQAPADSSEPHTEKSLSRWDVMIRSLQYIAGIAAQHDKDGIDIHFMISTGLNRTNITSGQEVLNLLTEVNLEQSVGGTYLEPALSDILGPYMARYRKYHQEMARSLQTVKPKPLNIIVLTDGKADDADELEEFLVKIGKELDTMLAPNNQIGIQFLQVGDDQEAAIYLEYLDDQIKSKYGIRDFIDKKTFKDLKKDDDAKSFAMHLRSILLGAVNRGLDGRIPTNK